MGRNNRYLFGNFTGILSSFTRTNGPQQSNTDQQSLGHLVFFRADQWAATPEKKHASYHRLRKPMGRNNVFVTNILTCIFYLVCTDQRTGQPECIYFVFFYTSYTYCLAAQRAATMCMAAKHFTCIRLLLTNVPLQSHRCSAILNA